MTNQRHSPRDSIIGPTLDVIHRRRFSPAKVVQPSGLFHALISQARGDVGLHLHDRSVIHA